MDKRKTKIAIVTRSLAHGGAERSCAMLSQLLHQSGFDVHVISVLDEIEYEYSGTLFNLGALKIDRFHRLLALKRYLKKHDFDWIIDSRIRSASWSEWIISKWIYDPKKVLYMVRSYNLENYFPKNKSIAQSIYKDAPFIVAVSDEIKEKIESVYHYKNVVRIYNPVDATAIHQNQTDSQKYIISYGRIDDRVKNYSLLIKAYALSDLPNQNILLYIVGDGVDVEKLKQKVITLQLQHKILFKPKMSNPFPMVKSALFTVLTSRYEGFPRVLIESLALGTPVISVDCHSGPREIIQNEKNGLLVENDNEIELSQAMNQLIQDKILYQLLKENAVQSVAHLSLFAIAKAWEQLLKK